MIRESQFRAESKKATPTVQLQKQQIVSSEDLTMSSNTRFEIHPSLATELRVDPVVTFKEFCVGFFNLQQEVGNLYDQKTKCFNAERYSFLQKYFGRVKWVSRADLKKYLLNRPQV